MISQGSRVLGEPAVPPIRVLLVDDSAEFLESAARFLETDPTLAIVGRAFSGPSGLEQIALLQPDLVLVDLMMPGMSGLELAGIVKSQPHPPRIVIVTLYRSVEYAAAFAAAHPDGWVAKSEFGTELLPLIRALFTRPPACRAEC